MKSKDGRRQEEEEREKEGRRSQREDVREIGGLTRWQGKREKREGGEELWGDVMEKKEDVSGGKNGQRKIADGKWW